MVQKNFDGKMPEPDILTSEDRNQLERMQGLVDSVRKMMDKQAIHHALDEIGKAFRQPINISPAKPVETCCFRSKRMGSTLYVTAESLRYIAVLAQPFMPDSMDRCWINWRSERQTHDSVFDMGRCAETGHGIARSDSHFSTL
jgi:methionyl-tRNA synthetase